MKGWTSAHLVAAPLVLGLTYGCRGSTRAPDLATRIAETCSSATCRVRLDSLVSSAWDTVWLVNRPLGAELDALPDLPPEARKTLADWDDGLGDFNAMVGTLDGHVAWSDACANNINENFNPPPCWWVVGDGTAGWARRGRDAAVFDVIRRVGPTENSLVLQPIE